MERLDGRVKPGHDEVWAIANREEGKPRNREFAADEKRKATSGAEIRHRDQGNP
jgi:hypothetical protein